MKWLDLAVKPLFSWPNIQVEFSFEGYKIVLNPRQPNDKGENNLAATVSVFNEHGITFEEGGTLLGRFLSRLAWSQSNGVEELFCIGSNNPEKPGRLGQGTYGVSAWAQTPPPDYFYIPKAKSFEADLALGLFREGMNVNSAPFAFLSYFKILNIVNKHGPPQKAWINKNIHKVHGYSAKNRLDKLIQSKEDVGAYLYHQGRCAVAHAHGTPLVNPDNYGDKKRLGEDLALIKEISALYIEKEFNVLMPDSYWQLLRNSTSHVEGYYKKIQNGNGISLYLEATESA